MGRVVAEPSVPHHHNDVVIFGHAQFVDYAHFIFYIFPSYCTQNANNLSRKTLHSRSEQYKYRVAPRWFPHSASNISIGGIGINLMDFAVPTHID
jgi:hypothetical protein